MIYSFMTLNDETEIVHSEAFQQNGKEVVRVYIEQPVDGGFNSAECFLPDYNWTKIEGFSKERIQYFQEFLESTAHIIIKLARTGGFDNASGF